MSERISNGKKLGIGAALVAVPLGIYQVVKLAANAGEASDKGLEKAFQYDTSALKEVDSKLVKYQEVGRIETGMEAPLAIAIEPSGTILVAGNWMIKRFAAGGSLLGSFDVGGEVHALAAREDGTILIAQKDHVEVFGADGARKASWKALVLVSEAYLTCIAVGQSGVYVADAGRRVVVRYSADGKVLNEIGRKDEARGIPGLIVPSPHLDVVVGKEGLIWLANPGMHRLEAYQPDGQLECYWGSAGTTIEAFFGCCNPADLAMLADGSCITAEKGLPRIKRYLPDGRFDSVVATPGMFGDNRQGLDIATNVKGEILVLERGMRVVRIFAPLKEGA